MLPTSWIGVACPVLTATVWPTAIGGKATGAPEVTVRFMML